MSERAVSVLGPHWALIGSSSGPHWGACRLQWAWDGSEIGVGIGRGIGIRIRIGIGMGGCFCFACMLPICLFTCPSCNLFYSLISITYLPRYSI